MLRDVHVMLAEDVGWVKKTRNESRVHVVWTNATSGK